MLVVLVASCNPIVSISLNEVDVEMKVGDSFELAATVNPAGQESSLWWVTSDDSVVSIDIIPGRVGAWMITARKVGDTEIQIGETSSGYFATCAITVIENTAAEIIVTGVSITPVSDSIVVGATIQISVEIEPLNADNMNVTWSSNNESVATINEAGIVEGLSVGSATITVTTEDGNFTAESLITVTSEADTSLSNLILSDGILSPVFSPEGLVYSASVAFITTSIDVFPIPTSSSSILSINGVENQSTVSLVEGDNDISIVVSDEAGNNDTTYILTVTRNAPVTDPSLSTVILSAGMLTPAFDTAIYSYVNQVPVSVDSVSFQFFGVDANISLLINSSIVLSSGQVYSSYPLSIGDNLLSVVVTAEDGSTRATYTFNVRRSESDEI